MKTSLWMLLSACLLAMLVIPVCARAEDEFQLGAAFLASVDEPIVVEGKNKDRDGKNGGGGGGAPLVDPDKVKPSKPDHPPIPLPPKPKPDRPDHEKHVKPEPAPKPPPAPSPRPKPIPLPVGPFKPDHGGGGLGFTLAELAREILPQLASGVAYEVRQALIWLVFAGVVLNGIVTLAIVRLATPRR